MEYWNDEKMVQGARYTVQGNARLREGGNRVPRAVTRGPQHYTPLLHSFEERSITMDIKVLGPGCPKCQQTEKNVKEVVSETGADAKVEKVTNLLEIAKYGVFGTPAVVVDGQVKSVGKIPTKDEIKKWIAKQ